MVDRNKILTEVAMIGEQDTFISELAKIVMPEDFNLPHITSVEAMNVWSIFELFLATDYQFEQAYITTLHWYERLKDE